jgi:hypothetical protein
MDVDRSDQAKQRHPSRALVARTDERALVPGARPRPLATFIAQLLACQTRMAQFRNRRRAPPPDAAARYRGPASAPASRFERNL